MLGSNAARKLAVKAMETKCLVPFCTYLLKTYSIRMVDQAYASQLLGIGACIQRYSDVLRRTGLIVSSECLQVMYDTIIRLFRLWELAGLHVKPKLHLLIHVLGRTAIQGNPAHYACWLDESLNKVLGQLGRIAHRNVWELRILSYYELAEPQRTKLRRF